MANTTTKMINKSDEEFKPKREAAQKLTFAQIQELVQRNVSRNINKTYTQFTKDTVKTYLQNPANSISNIIEISRFLERNSSLYKKILMYYATTPLYYYNLIQENDLSKTINTKKAAKDFYTVARQVQGFNIPKEMENALYCTVRDGMFVGFTYGDEESTFFMPLDVKYCRIYGRNSAGEWIVYFDRNFFSGNNVIFVEGIDGDTNGVWDQVFIDGYNGEDRWFMLPPERTFCMIAASDDQFDVPLPLFANLMTDIMSLEDLADLFESKSELENYKMLVSKIPLLDDGDIDDFGISLDLATNFNSALEQNIPELVAAVTSPMDLDVISFENSNKTNDSDMLAQSTQNLFNNAGVSQIVVAGGLSSNSIGLKFSLMNDLSNIWYYVTRMESWLNYYIKANISEEYRLKIHKMSWLNQEDYVTQMKDVLTMGGSAMDYLTCFDTPYSALQKLNFENSLGIKNLLVPPQTSYTMSGKTSNNTGGAPTKDETELTDSGVATRDGAKNEGTKANG